MKQHQYQHQPICSTMSSLLSMAPQFNIDNTNIQISEQELQDNNEGWTCYAYAPGNKIT